MAAMASMAPLIQTAIAAAPRAGRLATKQQLHCSQLTSTTSWACRAMSKDEEMPVVSNVGLNDVVDAIQQATTQAEPAAPEEPELGAEAPSSALSSTTAPQQLTGAAEWYKLYGRSVAPSEDARDVYYGPNRPLWKGPFTTPKDVPAYLIGEFPGDYGCDIFKLARLPANYARLRTQELMNARWAMLGITGCLGPELINPNPTPGFEPVWFKTGSQIFSEAGIDYLGLPGFVNAHSLFAVVTVQAALMGLSEYARIRFVPEGVDPFYPGGKAFDPLGLGSDPEILAELKVKEIKNGRLAMMAMAGLFAQGGVTGVSPLQNLHDYLHF